MCVSLCVVIRYGKNQVLLSAIRCWTELHTEVIAVRWSAWVRLWTLALRHCQPFSRTAGGEVGWCWGELPILTLQHLGGLWQINDQTWLTACHVDSGANAAPWCLKNDWIWHSSAPETHTKNFYFRLLLLSGTCVTFDLNSDFKFWPELPFILYFPSISSSQ